MHHRTMKGITMRAAEVELRIHHHLNPHDIWCTAMIDSTVFRSGKIRYRKKNAYSSHLASLNSPAPFTATTIGAMTGGMSVFDAPSGRRRGRACPASVLTPSTARRLSPLKRSSLCRASCTADWGVFKKRSSKSLSSNEYGEYGTTSWRIIAALCFS